MPDLPHTILVLGAAEDDPPDGLLPAPEGVTLRFLAGPPSDQALRGVEAVLVWSGRGQDLEAAWSTADKVRWIHAASAGVDRLLFPALIASDVVVTNSRGVFDIAMAEYALALMLHHAAGIGVSLEAQREHRWSPRAYAPVRGRKAVVVGAGSIGRAVARLARAVGMDVQVVARSARPDAEFGAIAAQADLIRILPGAAFVVLVVPATPQSRGLMGAEELAAMDPGAVLVNIGRGSLVDEAALLEALRSGRLGGAALDVFATEPLPPQSPLWDAPGVLVSPHMAGDFAGFEQALVALFRAQLTDWLAGRPLRNVVDKELGFVV